MVADTTDSLGAMHRSQVHRDRWPQWGAFSPAAYPPELRREAAVQWAGRARAEHGSIHQFAAVAHTLAELRAPLHLLGAVARLITDEVRHAEICAQMALTLFPEALEPGVEDHLLRWPIPHTPWPDAPPLRRESGEEQLALRWAIDAILTACCLGETLSVPMLQAIATVATEPVAGAVAEQILRDEHLHARFGWEALAVLMPRLDPEHLPWLHQQLARHLAGFEASTCIGVRLPDLLDDPSISIEPGDPAHPNLGVLTHRQYAMIFYHTLEQEIFPGLQALGLDPARAWAERGA